MSYPSIGTCALGLVFLFSKKQKSPWQGAKFGLLTGLPVSAGVVLFEKNKSMDKNIAIVMTTCFAFSCVGFYINFIPLL